MNQKEQSICLLLGSNIRPEENLLRALNFLQKEVAVVQTSSVWESQAVGSDGPNFLNAAVLAMSALDADTLKEGVFRPLEVRLGRVRTKDKNAPRTIDIDLILFGKKLLDPSLWHYAYMAVPVSELVPHYLSGTGEHLKDIASNLARSASVLKREDVSGYPFSTIFQK